MAQSPPPPRSSRGWIYRGLGAAVVVYLAWCLIMFVIQGRLIFPAAMAGPGGMSTPDHWQRLAITNEFGPFRGLLWVPAAATAEHPVPLAVAYHGNAELAEHFSQTAEVRNLVDLGFAVLVPEYRGYGDAAGSPSQQGIVRDTVAIIDAAAKLPGIDARRRVDLGRSLGGGVACAVARQRPPAAAILQSTFTSVASFATRYGVPSFIVLHPFRNDEAVEAMDVPLLIFHGTRDEVIPVAHGRKLAGLARRGEYEEVVCGHLDFPPDAAWYRARVARFLAEHGLKPGG